MLNEKDRLTTGLNFLQCHPEQREGSSHIYSFNWILPLAVSG